MRASSIVSAGAHLAVILALLWTQQALDANEVPGVEAVNILFVAPPAPAAGHGGDNAAPGPTETGMQHARASDTPPAPAPSVDAPDEAPVPAPPETAKPDRPEKPPVQLAALPQPVERKVEPTPDPPVAQQVEIVPPKPLPLPKLKPEQPVLEADLPEEVRPPEPTVEKAPAPPEPAAPASRPAPSPTDTQIAHSDPTQTVTRQTVSGGSTSDVQSASLPSASDDLPASTGGGEAGNGEAGPAGGGAASEDYAALLAAWLDEHKRYPERARRKNQEGVVVFAFEIDAEGRVLHHRIVEGSGYPLLDEEVTALIDRATPLPAPPPGVARNYVVPIVFALR